MYELEELHTQLNSDRSSGEWQFFTRQAYFMKILAAEKVEITDQGLQLTMPKRKSAVAPTPPIPEVRAF